MNKILITVLIVGLILVGCSKQESLTESQPIEYSNLEGRVYYDNWIGISDAKVCLEPYGCQLTDERAWYNYENIVAGKYQITVKATGYNSSYATINVRPEGTTSFHFKLEPSSQ